jgi:hypothetical protein
MSKVSHNAQGRLYWPEATSIDRNGRLYREYYMTLSVSHPVSTRNANIGRGLIRDVMRKEPYHIIFIIYLNMRKFCSVLWTFSLSRDQYHLRGMIKGWWYRYQSRQTNTVVMFFQYYICQFPLFSTKYVIKLFYYHFSILFKYWNFMKTEIFETFCFIIFQYYYLNIKILKFYENWNFWKCYHFEIFWKFWINTSIVKI